MARPDLRNMRMRVGKVAAIHRRVVASGGVCTGQRASGVVVDVARYRGQRAAGMAFNGGYDADDSAGESQ